MAAADAKRFHTPLILTFHRIHATATDRPGYPLKSFERIVDGIAKTGVRVVTLADWTGLTEFLEDDRVVVRAGAASQIVVNAKVTSSKPLGLLDWMQKHA